MFKQGAEASPEGKDRAVSLLLMVFFLLLGVAWGMTVTAELKSRSTSVSRRVARADTSAAIPQTGGQER